MLQTPPKNDTQILDPPLKFSENLLDPPKKRWFLAQFRPILGLFFNLFKTLPRVSEKTLTPLKTLKMLCTARKNTKNGIYPPLP